jgi:DNA-binding NarL/FixJ family response regulator
MKNKIKIMYVEDHKILRDCVISLLNENENFEIIGEAENGLEILKLLRTQIPDIIISDIEMPEMNGFELFDTVKKQYPDIKFIFLSMHYSNYLTTEMSNKGVNACLPKECGIEILEIAILEVYKSGFYLNNKTYNSITSNYINQLNYSSLIKQVSLSARELEILKLICDGKTNKEVSEKLKITIATIDFHRQNIYKKTCCDNFAQLVKYAIRNGILPLD